MMDIEKSDAMICNNRVENAYKYNRMNEVLLRQQLGQTQPTQLRDIDAESSKWKGLETRVYCNSLINSRGTNANKPCVDDMPCVGYNCYTPFHMSEHALVPCQTNTFRNYVACEADGLDNPKCCSVHHQIFMNVTKRKGIELPQNLIYDE